MLGPWRGIEGGMIRTFFGGIQPVVLDFFFYLLYGFARYPLRREHEGGEVGRRVPVAVQSNRLRLTNGDRELIPNHSCREIPRELHRGTVRWLDDPRRHLHEQEQQ